MPAISQTSGRSTPVAQPSAGSATCIYIYIRGKFAKTDLSYILQTLLGKPPLKRPGGQH